MIDSFIRAAIWLPGTNFKRAISNYSRLITPEQETQVCGTE